jgi:hypothetical protein
VTEAVSYESFGEEFIRASVTADRIVRAAKRVAGDAFTVGPMRAGPGKRASVLAKGTIGEPVATPRPEEVLAYTVTVPIDVAISVRAGVHGHFDAHGEIRLTLRVLVEQPLAIVIDVAEVKPGDVSFKVQARDIQSRLMQVAHDIEGEIRTHAAAHVNAQAQRPEATYFTRVELLPLIEASWAHM